MLNNKRERLIKSKILKGTVSMVVLGTGLGLGFQGISINNDNKVAEAYGHKYNVSYVNSVDGDTVKVKKNGKVITLRLLLVDTPETKHPKLGVQPYGKEASNKTKNLVSRGQKLSIEYDKGAKTDKYGRHLVYLYSNGKSVQKELLGSGLARVGYVYSQKQYLNEYKRVENKAKSSKKGIWSKTGYVNIKGEGFNTNKSKVKSQSKPKVKSNVSKKNNSFKNCTEMRKVYPKGVRKGHPAYQTKMDRDRDGFACVIS